MTNVGALMRSRDTDLFFGNLAVIVGDEQGRVETVGDLDLVDRLHHPRLGVLLDDLLISK